jgi:alginate O-acetyltransferase complex protein AlgI
MPFSSVSFLLYFLPVFMAAYYVTPSVKGKNRVTLVFSLLFYAWGEPHYVVLLLGSTLFNMYAALRMDQRDGRARRSALAAAVAVNLGVLALFKYAGFIIANANVLLLPARLAIPDPHIPLPLGISFFTFHCLSYLIDVYRRRFPAERDPSIVGLYIVLFPQLIAGPIVRYKTVARQLRWRRHTLGRTSAGMRMFIIGLAQKVLVADQLAPLVATVFDQTARPLLVEAWTGLLAYTLQIYFDFSGYSNMAIGLGICLGFSLPRNFRLPYSARSVTEFWRRWHISLSSWLRDYLYIPLGGSRGRRWQTYRNLVLVFLLCGLWHGAAWTFLLWGVWHGFFLVIERVGVDRVLHRLPSPVPWIYTLLVVMAGWVLFRAHDLNSALGIYGALIGLHGVDGNSLEFRAAVQPFLIVMLAVGCVLSVAPSWLTTWLKRSVLLIGWRPLLDAVWTLALLLLAVICVGAGTFSPFLYFRF